MDWPNKLILTDASIPDIVAFKDAMRDFEDDVDGMLYPPIITYKKLDVGGGAFFHGVELINGYQLKFTTTGVFEIIGNIGGTIVPDLGVFVSRIKALAFASIETGSGLSTEQSTQLDEVHSRLDLDVADPITYEKDLSTISNTKIGTLTKTDNGNETVTLQRS